VRPRPARLAGPRCHPDSDGCPAARAMAKRAGEAAIRSTYLSTTGRLRPTSAALGRLEWSPGQSGRPARAKADAARNGNGRRANKRRGRRIAAPAGHLMVPAGRPSSDCAMARRTRGEAGQVFQPRPCRGYCARVGSPLLKARSDRRVPTCAMMKPCAAAGWYGVAAEKTARRWRRRRRGHCGCGA